MTHCRSCFRQNKKVLFLTTTTLETQVTYQPPAGPPPGEPGQPNWSAAGPPPPPAKKSKKWLWIVLAAVVVIIVISVAVGGGGNDESDKTAAATSQPAVNAETAVSAAPVPAAEEKKGKTVVYEVTGDAGSATSITFFTNGSNQSQDNGAAIPWSKEITLDDGDFTLLGVSAQSGGDGEIGCKVTVDGEVKAENTSNGAYAVVMCNVDPF